MSRTDPEAGYMKRPGKPNGFYYLSHQTTDPDHGIITAVTVTPGDVHDSQPYLKQLEYVHKNVVPLKAAAADSAFDFPLAHGVLEELGIDFFVVPQPAYDRTKAGFKRDAFTYEEQRDVYLCPNGKELRRKRLCRSGSGLFWEYWADKKNSLDIQIRIAEIDAEFKAMLQAIATDTVEDIDEQRATELMNEKNSLEQQLSKYDNAQQEKENTKSRLDEIFTILEGLENHPMEYDDRLIRQVLECVVVESKERIKVVFAGWGKSCKKSSKQAN